MFLFDGQRYYKDVKICSYKIGGYKIGGGENEDWFKGNL